MQRPGTLKEISTQNVFLILQFFKRKHFSFLPEKTDFTPKEKILILTQKSNFPKEKIANFSNKKIFLYLPEKISYTCQKKTKFFKQKINYLF